MDYVGGEAIMSFRMLDASRGCNTRCSAIAVGNVVYFPSEEGFMACDGSRVFPVGQDRVDKFWRERVSTVKTRNNVFASYSPQMESIFWTVPGLDNSRDVIGYRPALDKWYKVQAEGGVACLFAHVPQEVISGNLEEEPTSLKHMDNESYLPVPTAMGSQGTTYSKGDIRKTNHSLAFSDSTYICTVAGTSSTSHPHTYGTGISGGVTLVWDFVGIYGDNSLADAPLDSRVSLEGESILSYIGTDGVFRSFGNEGQPLLASIHTGDFEVPDGRATLRYVRPIWESVDFRLISGGASGRLTPYDPSEMSQLVWSSRAGALVAAHNPSTEFVDQVDTSTLLASGGAPKAPNTDAASGGQIQLTFGQGDDDYYAPFMAPDHGDVILQKGSGASSTGICRISLDDYSETLVISGTLYTPSYSPDGSKISFIKDPGSLGNSEIYTCNADGTGETQITDDGQGESSFGYGIYGGFGYNPSGTHFVFSRRTGTFPDRTANVYTVPVAGGTETAITSLTSGGETVAGGASFNGDGQWIAYWLHDPNDASAQGVYIVSADGSQGPFKLQIPIHEGGKVYTASNYCWLNSDTIVLRQHLPGVGVALNAFRHRVLFNQAANGVCPVTDTVRVDDGIYSNFTGETPYLYFAHGGNAVTVTHTSRVYGGTNRYDAYYNILGTSLANIPTIPTPAQDIETGPERSTVTFGRPAGRYFRATFYPGQLRWKNFTGFDFGLVGSSRGRVRP